MRYSASIPWPFDAPLSRDLAESAIGRPVTLGASDEVVGEIVDAYAMTSLDPPRLIVSIDVGDRPRGGLSIDVAPYERIYRAAYLPPWRVVA